MAWALRLTHNAILPLCTPFFVLPTISPYYCYKFHQPTQHKRWSYWYVLYPSEVASRTKVSEGREKAGVWHGVVGDGAAVEYNYRLVQCWILSKGQIFALRLSLPHLDRSIWLLARKLYIGVIITKPTSGNQYCGGFVVLITQCWSY